MRTFRLMIQANSTNTVKVIIKYKVLITNPKKIIKVMSLRKQNY